MSKKHSRRLLEPSESTPLIYRKTRGSVLFDFSQVRQATHISIYTEGAMREQIHQQSALAAASAVFKAISNWVEKYRSAIGLRDELAHCGTEEVARIAHDIGLGSEEFASLASNGPHAADQLPRLLRALGVDPVELASVDPAMLRGLERICITCGHKDQCEHDLAAGTAAQGSYNDYCPNAKSLNAIFDSKFEM